MNSHLSRRSLLTKIIAGSAGVAAFTVLPISRASSTPIAASATLESWLLSTAKF